MCVIIHLPPGATLERETLENCYANNPHGWGIMWHEPELEQIWYAKDTTPFSSFWETWQDIPSTVPRAVHFRIKTHGPVNKDNCHPFFVSHRLGLMHNGILPVEEENNAYSDTWHFVEYDLKPILGDADTSLISEDTPLGQVIDDFISTSSRLLFMDNLGQVVRYGSWTTLFGCSFSNSYSHVAKRVPALASTYQASPYSYDKWWEKGNAWKDKPKVTPEDSKLIEAEVTPTLTEAEKYEGIELNDVEFDTYDKANKYRKENGGFVKCSKGVYTVCNTRVKVDNSLVNFNSVQTLVDFERLTDDEKMEYIKKYPKDTFDLLCEAMYY